MADNTQLNPGVGGNLISDEEIGPVHVPRTKLVLGPFGTDGGDVSTANPLPVEGQQPDGMPVAGNPVLVGGSTTGGTTKILSVDGSGRAIVVGAGLPGVPFGGVVSVQGEPGAFPLAVSQGTGAAAGAPWSVELSDGAAFYVGAKTGQLPAALVGGRLDENLGAWLGSTAPTVGQKTMASSVPVTIASDQTPVATQEKQPSSAATTTVAGSAASVTLLAANATRLGASIFNASTATLYIKFGAGATTVAGGYNHGASVDPTSANAIAWSLAGAVAKACAEAGSPLSLNDPGLATLQAASQEVLTASDAANVLTYTSGRF